MKKQPPKWADRFLYWFCRPEYLEEIAGDLYEMYTMKSVEKGQSYADKTYFFDVMKFFRWSNFKRMGTMNTSFNTGLLAHNFKITLRVFKKNMLYTGINLAGLVVGLTAFVFLLVYYLHENSYDNQFADGEHIYRIDVHANKDGSYAESAKSPVPLVATLNGTIPQAVNYTRALPYSGLVSNEIGTKYREDQFVFVDQQFLEMFPPKLIQGTLNTALDAPFQIVLTEKKAKQYFGSENPIGKTIAYESEDAQYDFTVMAVVEDISTHSHLNIDFMATFSSLDRIIPWYKNWFYPNVYSYVQLDEQANSKEVEMASQEILEKNGFIHYVKQKPQLFFQPVQEIHLSSNKTGEWKPNNTQIDLGFFLSLGFIILLIAVINYINLTTAESQRRSKEIGIKKAMGSAKIQLIKQFFIESFLMINLAMLLTVVMVFFLWRTITFELMGIDLILINYLTWSNMGMFIVGGWILSVLVGIYPAFITIRYSAIDVIKNNLSKYMGKGYQRKVLVVTQFSISMCLIIGTVLLIKQYDFLQNKELGYQKDFRLAINLSDDYSKQNFTNLRDQLLQLPFVENAAVSNTLMGSPDGFHEFPISISDKPDLVDLELHTLGVGENYLDTYGIEILLGRNFDPTIQSDELGAFIVNEAAAKLLGWGTNAVGKDMSLTLYTGKAELREGKVIGLAKDFHYQSLYEQIKPLVIYINKHIYYTDFLNIQLNPKGSIAEKISEIEKVFTEFNPKKPMEISFVEDELERIYQRELASSKIISLFTLLSILIASLGVFGLASYSSKRRIKEIGIRKVLGASANHITVLLTKEYFYMIVLSCLIAWPLVYFVATEWLSNFAYATQFGIENYLIGLLILTLIAVVSSMKQTIWSVKSNPVEHLRDE